MTAIIIIITIAFFAGQTIAMKFIHVNSLMERLCVYAAFSLFAAGGMAACMAMLPALRGISIPTLCFGLVFGILFALTIVFYNLAISTGPLSYTTFYFSASMLIPSAAGVLLFKEPLRVTLVIAIVLFLGAFFLLNKGDAPQSPRKGWGLWCALTFICNGICAVLQKAQQATVQGEPSGLMLTGFSSAFVCYFAAVAYLVIKSKAKPEKASCTVTGAKENVCSGCNTPTNTVPTLKACSRIGHAIYGNFAPMLVLAAASLGGNLLLTSLSGQMPSAYLFPLVQGSIIVVVTLASVLFFKEKLSSYGKIGIFLGICAIVIINL